MMRPQRLPTLLALLLAGPSAALAGDVRVNGRTFTLPAGFTIERVAGPPMIDRPVVADFDEQGRLYVADSSGSNDKVEKQLAETPHRIVRLEDTDGDGTFDRRTVFADKMMFPSGAMWLDGSLYVSAPPSIWKLTDTDGDGVADVRVEWFKGKTLTGCANDLHGPYLGRDGWIYWCKGAFAKQTYERPGKPPFVTRAAHIFRCRPAGWGIEAVMTGGMDNPVDVVFTPGGERVFTTTFLQHPGDGKRDGLIHAVYGGVWGKVHDVIEDHPRTRPDMMPVLAQLGAAAPSGLTIAESSAFGPGYEGNLFACLFNMRKITRHVLQPSGGTFATTTEDFLVSEDRDFHPTDIVEDADGSLLVIDTGGWYKLCCPTSQLPKPDVLGAIYRVKRADAKRVVDPRGKAEPWATATADGLIQMLSDDRPAVRRRAADGLARMRIDALPKLEQAVRTSPSARVRLNSVWAATRVEGLQARFVVQTALSDRDATVRQAALHSVSLWRDKTAVPLLVLELDKDQVEPLLRHNALDPRLDDLVAQNRRVAAEALGRIGDKAAVPFLLIAAGEEATGPILAHSITYALIEIADAKGTSVGLKSTMIGTQRAALVALDQMPGGGLQPSQVIPFLRSSDWPTSEAASWIIGRHPKWAEALAGFLRERLGEEDLIASAQAQLVDQIARFGGEAPVQTLLGKTLLDPKTSPKMRRVSLRAMAKSGPKEVPQAWVDGISKALGSNDAQTVREAVACARSLPTAKGKTAELAAALTDVGSDPKRQIAVRLDALQAVPDGLSTVSPDLFASLRECLDTSRPVATRTAAATVLARAKLTDGQRLTLLDNVKTAGPLELDTLLGAFETPGGDDLGLKLVAALNASAAKASIRVDTLKPRLDKFGERVRDEASKLYASLNADAPAQKAKLEAMLPTLTGGDIRRGQEVFNGPKAACLTCHAIGYLGGKVGPDLSGIGELRTERDLLESILFPSLSFVRSYEPVTIATRDGKVVNGLLKADSADEVAVATNATEVVRVPRAEIEEMRPGTVSVMPAGLDQQLTRTELSDLLAFLKSRK